MYGVTKLTVTEDVSLITLNSIPCNLGPVSQILTELSTHGINIDMISQSSPKGELADVSFTTDSAQVIPALELINRFREQHPSVRPLVNYTNCKVQLYGEEMRHTPGVAAAVFTTVARLGGNIMLVTTSEVDISLLLSPEHLPEVVQALREQFCLE